MAIPRALSLALLCAIVAGTSAQAGPFGPPASANAFINLGTGSYAASDMIASGDPLPWYDGAQVSHLFGGTPTAQQQRSFDQAVMQDVQATFRLSGIPITLSDDPAVSAAHMISLVSNASSAPFPGAIGTTDLGASGLSFIDPMAGAAQSVGQLEWIAAHNIAHELMLALGVGEDYDRSGNYIDARDAKLSMLIDPKATFSADAAAAIVSKLGAEDPRRILEPVAQAIGATTEVNATPAPEPATLIVWGMMTLASISAARSRRRTR